MSTVEIDGVLYEKHEDREGVITFTPVEQKTHKLEFTERELNMIVNLSTRPKYRGEVIAELNGDLLLRITGSRARGARGRGSDD